MTRTMIAHVLTCRACGAPITFGAPFCSYCRAPAVWGDTVDLERGDDVVAFDMVRGSPPANVPGTHTRAGLLVESKADTFSHHVVSRPMRDACVTIRGTTLDASGTLGIFARLNTQGSIKTAYDLRVYPALRSFTFRRIVWGTKKTHASAMRESEHSRFILPPNTMNEIELRYADSVFQIVINGKRVATVIDPSFGYGAVAWRAGAMPQMDSRVLIESVYVRRVS
jgi:hypothetical protein